VCTRNYAEWRTSWANGEAAAGVDSSTQVVLESMPLVLEGHPQQVECLTTDGAVVASTCLSGEVRSWNVFSGECMAVINRRRQVLSHTHKEPFTRLIFFLNLYFKLLIFLSWLIFYLPFKLLVWSLELF